MGIWRSLPQRGMWTLHIIEIHVFPDAFFEFFYGMIVPSIQFLAFERGEKGFHDCVITGFSRRRKGLLYMKCFEQLLKSKGGILSTPIPPLVCVLHKLSEKWT